MISISSDASKINMDIHNILHSMLPGKIEKQASALKFIFLNPRNLMSEFCHFSIFEKKKMLTNALCFLDFLPLTICELNPKHTWNES